MRQLKKRRLGAVAPSLFVGLVSLGVVALPSCGASRSRSEATDLSNAATTPHIHIAASRCATNRAAGTVTFVSPFGYDASAGILDVIVAKQLGYFADLCLKVDIVASASNPYALVSSGRGTVTGEGSAADDLVEVANGDKFTAIATYGDTSDYALLTTKSITNLRQLEGKTLAYHTVLPVALKEMLQSAGVDLSKVHLVDDNSYDPTLLERGRFQALQAYQSNEPLTLAADHDPFKEWVPSSFGVKGTFNVQVMNSAFLKDHRAAATDFLRAELHAFSYCAQGASRCISIEASVARAAGEDYVSSHESAEWAKEVALSKDHTLAGRGVGVESTAEWQPEEKAVVRYGLAKRLTSLGSVLDTTMAASLYKGKTLIWPGS